MGPNRDELLTDLRGSVIECTFQEPAGRYNMRFTLRADLLPQSANNIQESMDDFHRQNPKVVAAWDVKDRRWRSFDVDSVVYVQDVSANY